MLVNVQNSGGGGRNRTLSDAELEAAALPLSYTPVAHIPAKPALGLDPRVDAGLPTGMYQQ
jgi:hypothetical protein